MDLVMEELALGSIHLLLEPAKQACLAESNPGAGGHSINSYLNSLLLTIRNIYSMRGKT
jgi:hypothetical protein